MTSTEKGSAPPAYTDVPPEGQMGNPTQAGYGYNVPPGGYNAPPTGYGAPQGYGAPPAQGYYPPPQGYQYQPQAYGYNNVVVAQPGQYVASAGPPPPDHMCAAIFVTLCCFWPTGIVAIMRASDARSALARGDVVGANSYAKSAKSMVNISIIVGIICLCFMAIIIGVYFGIIFKNLNDYDRD